MRGATRGISYSLLKEKAKSGGEAEDTGGFFRKKRAS